MLHGYKILVYCTTKIHGDRFLDFIRSLSERLIKSNWRVMIFYTEAYLYGGEKVNEGGNNIFELINYDIADAVLISDPYMKDVKLKKNLIAKAKAHGLPVFLVDGQSLDTFNICFTYEPGFKALIEHLITEHKITNFHFMAGRADSVESNMRLEIFKTTLLEHRIPFDDEMLSYGDFWDMPTKKACQKILDSGNIPEAIVCANDTMAIATIDFFNSHGYPCPEKIIVTGFDGIKDIFYSSPRITSCVCDHEKLGAKTADFIQKVISEGEDAEPYTEFVDTDLCVQESCGCKAITSSNTLELITRLNNSYNRFRNEDNIFNNLSVAIHACKNLDELINTLKNDMLYNMFCCIKSECLDESTDPNMNYSSTPYGNTMFVTLDSDNKSSYANHYIKTSDLIPRMEDVLDQYKNPLIFTPLNDIDIPLGYLCFCFTDYNPQNYARVAQIASWLSNAISGYRNMSYQRHLQKEIEGLYQHDALTNLLNRTGFTRIYNTILEDSSITNMSLAMCDLDNLKKINDHFSHNEGDEAIKVVAAALSEAIPDGYFCRYGGDEILGLYPYNVDVKKLLFKVDEYIKQYNRSSNKPYEVSTSIGVYCSKKIPFEEMFDKADKLMYDQKVQKKNRRQ